MAELLCGDSVTGKVGPVATNRYIPVVSPQNGCLDCAALNILIFIVPVGRHKIFRIFTAQFQSVHSNHSSDMHA